MLNFASFLCRQKIDHWNGLKISTKRYFIGLYLFSYRIDQLIERYRNEDNIYTYTYDNIHRGKILGGEIEVQYTPLKNVNFFGHYFYYKGRSDIENEPLNDIPAPRFYVGGKIFFNLYCESGKWAEVA